LINLAIKKYGRENFEKEIIAFEDDKLSKGWKFEIMETK
jgi:hypothetical protein